MTHGSFLGLKTGANKEHCSLSPRGFRSFYEHQLQYEYVSKHGLKYERRGFKRQIDREMLKNAYEPQNLRDGNNAVQDEYLLIQDLRSNTPLCIVSKIEGYEYINFKVWSIKANYRSNFKEKGNEVFSTSSTS